MTDRTKPLEGLKLYTLTELEPILGITHRTLLSYMKKGRIKGKIIAKKWRVTEDALREFLDGAGADATPSLAEDEGH